MVDHRVSTQATSTRCVCHNWFVCMRSRVWIILDCVLSSEKSCVKSIGRSHHVTCLSYEQKINCLVLE